MKPAPGRLRLVSDVENYAAASAIAEALAEAHDVQSSGGGNAEAVTLRSAAAASADQEQHPTYQLWKDAARQHRHVHHVAEHEDYVKADYSRGRALLDKSANKPQLR